ncbi:hypothetical protein [Acuticoccus yangtzensis]|uniref:hypothetical protein n=1 Tax=Acuticoccus yangtzensis TaxID=1443441 RepID=UPI0011150ACC|nr:hypothetical protein [Acuticoccus yangtzensis]
MNDFARNMPRLKSRKEYKEAISTLKKAERLSHSYFASILTVIKNTTIREIVDDELPEKNQRASIENIARLEGLTISSVAISVNTLKRMNFARTELEDEMNLHFPSSGPGAPINPRAHFVAARLAAAYVRCRREKPELGWNSKQEPITPFAKAITEICALLRLGTDGQSAAEAAVANISEQDLNDARRPIGLLGIDFQSEA